MTNPKPTPKKSLRLIAAAKKQSEFLAVIPRTWKVPLKEGKIFKPITRRGDCNRLIAFDRQFKLLYRRPRCTNEIGSNGFPVKARLKVFIERGDGIFGCAVSNILKIGFCTITLRFFGFGVSCGFRFRSILISGFRIAQIWTLVDYIQEFLVLRIKSACSTIISELNLGRRQR